MKKLSLLIALICPFMPVWANVLHPCEPYVLGQNANPKIPLFGGLNPAKPVTQVANLMLKLVPKYSDRQIQMAVPVSLFYNPHQAQQFGDGVQNANLSFGPSDSSPLFVSLLARGLSPSEPAQLMLQLSKDFPAMKTVTQLELSILGERSTISADANGLYKINVDPDKLHWNQLLGASPVYFRPAGWKDWFAVRFPQAYVSIPDLIKGMAERYRYLPNGKNLVSIVDPLGLKGTDDPRSALLRVPDAQNLGFILAPPVGPRVHGVFINDVNQQSITATGTATTRYRLPSPTDPAADFEKLIYLEQSARNLSTEWAEGVASGTGPHRIGSPATAEIILNSLGSEALMTFHGIQTVENGPDGERLAWGDSLSQLYIGTWLQADMAFVAPQGDFHEHLTHTIGRSVFAQVITPPQVPSANNHFGFPRQ